MKNVIFYLLLLILVYTIWRFVMFYYKNPFSRSLDILPFLVCWHLLFSRTHYLNCFNFCLSINLWLLLKFLLAYIPICTWILSYWGCYASNISSAAFSIFFKRIDNNIMVQWEPEQWLVLVLYDISPKNVFLKCFLA